MVNLFSKSKSSKYQGFSKYNDEMSRYLSPHQPSTGLGRSLSMTSGRSSDMASSAAAAAAAASAASSGRSHPTSSSPVNRSYSLLSNRAPRSNSMRSYVYNPVPSYHTGPPVRSNSLTHPPRSNSLASRQRYIPDNNDYIDEDDEVIVTTKTTKVLDRNGRTQSLTTQITKVLPDGSRVVETTSKNISRSNSRANSIGSARNGSILSSPSISNQALTLGKIDEDLRDFDYSYAMNNDHLGAAIAVPDMPPNFGTLEGEKLDDNASASVNRLEPKLAPSNSLSPELSVHENQFPANRSNSISSRNSSQKPLRSILKSTPRPQISDAPPPREINDPTCTDLALSNKAEQVHQPHPYALLSPMDSASVPPSPARIAASNTEPDIRSPSNPKQSRTSSITFDTITKTIPIYDHENSRPKHNSKPNPKRKTLSDAEFYAAALRAAHKNVYGDREVPPAECEDPDPIEEKVPASPSPVIPRDDALDSSYQYENHAKEFSMRSMKDAPPKTVSRKERAKEEKHRAKLERDHAKQEQARLAKLEKESQAKLAKEAHENDVRLAKEAKETEARLAKEAKEKAKHAKEQAKHAKEYEKPSLSQKKSQSGLRRFLQVSTNGSVHTGGGGGGVQGLGLSLEPERKRGLLGFFKRRNSVASSTISPPCRVPSHHPELPAYLTENHIETDAGAPKSTPASDQAGSVATVESPDPLAISSAKPDQAIVAEQNEIALPSDNVATDGHKSIALSGITEVAPINKNGPGPNIGRERASRNHHNDGQYPNVSNERFLRKANTAGNDQYPSQTLEPQDKSRTDTNLVNSITDNASDFCSSPSELLNPVTSKPEPQNDMSHSTTADASCLIQTPVARQNCPVPIATAINPRNNSTDSNSAVSTDAEIKSTTLFSGHSLRLIQPSGSSHTVSSSGSNRDVSPSSFVRVQKQGSHVPSQFAASPKMSVNSVKSITSISLTIENHDGSYDSRLAHAKMESSGGMAPQDDISPSSALYPVLLAICPPNPADLSSPVPPSPPAHQSSNNNAAVDTAFINFDGLNNNSNVNIISVQPKSESPAALAAPKPAIESHANQKPSPSLSNRSFAVTSPLSNSETASIVNDDTLIFATPLANTAGSNSEVPTAEPEKPLRVRSREETPAPEPESGGRFKKVLFKYFVKS